MVLGVSYYKLFKSYYLTQYNTHDLQTEIIQLYTVIQEEPCWVVAMMSQKPT